ncbi:MAG: alpha/beta hydrolase [Gammaproteobacteria bacterium]|nr:MAG: alpha/beta hydrolase [Gammaproteobacteria bacterium]RLA60372.1 MAG: alpha/beta hydrolase [Gammaproteobacteria bacterium]
MNNMAKAAIKRSLALNQKVAKTAANGVDWLFKRDTLIKSGRTWFELVHDGDLMSVRYYELPEEDEIELVDGTTMPIRRKQHALPLVLVPPLGVTTEAFDLMPQRSLVRYLAASGFKVYLVDWGKPKKEHGHLGLRDYTYTMLGTALEKVREHSGSRDLSMLGWCLGGLFCLLYQGQTLDKHMRNIVTVASPIDPQSGSGVVAGVVGAAQALNGPAQLVSNYSNLRLNTLDPSRLSMPPWLTTLVFKMTDPIGSVTTYWDLVTRLSDREFVESHSTTGDYLNHMLMYPGGVLKDMAVTVTDNQLAKGKVELGGNIAELDAIESNLLAFAGENDILVPPDIAEQIVDIVASKDKEFRVAPGGHMGVIIGSKAQSAVWAESVEWLAGRSGKVKVKAKAKRKVRTKVKARARPKRKTG